MGALGIETETARVRPAHPLRRFTVELLVGGMGILLLVFAWVADLHWFERHWMQFYFVHTPSDLWVVRISRWTSAVLGVFLLAFGRKWLSAAIARTSLREWAGSTGRIALSILLAIVVSEIALRKLYKPRFTQDRAKATYFEDRLGRLDPRYGWVYLPSRATVVTTSGRAIQYAFNQDGFRSPSIDWRPDPDRPTILFTGESIVAGHGLFYEESFPTLVSKRLGVQGVNLAMHGYGNDQAFLRLVDAMPRFKRVLATVTLFFPAQLERNVAPYRARLALGRNGEFERIEPVRYRLTNLRLFSLLRPFFPHSDEAIPLTAAILRQTAARTRAIGAIPLFVVLAFGPPRPLKEHPEGWIIQTLLEDQHLPYVLVHLDGSWLLPGDGHPDARASQALAEGVERALRAAGLQGVSRSD